jgi:hypothetical protein
VTLAAYFQAQHVNQAAGGPFVAPWDVQNLPREWIDGALAITTRLEAARKAQRKIDARMEAWRNAHPTYRKRYH